MPEPEISQIFYSSKIHCCHCNLIFFKYPLQMENALSNVYPSNYGVTSVDEKKMFIYRAGGDQSTSS